MKNNDRMLRKKLNERFIMSVAATAAIVLFSWGIPGGAPAADVSGDSRTYLQSREDLNGSKVLGGYEYLDFAVQDIGGETVSFHTGGWLRYDFKAEQFGKKSTSDLQYSYLSVRRKTDNAVLDLGRVMVFEGVAAERVDGVSARADFAGGFGISAFGGMPVETNSDLPGNNVLYGGRLSQGGDRHRIGLSALQEEKNSLDYRKEAGVDLWIHPAAKADLNGRSSYNDITKDWMEHSYALLLGPFANLRFGATAQWINYDDYFYRATANAFILQQGIIEPREKVRILGEEVSWSVTDKVMVSADYRNFTYKIAGTADYFGGKINFSVPVIGGVAGAGYHRMRGESDKLRYHEYRIYAWKNIGRLTVTADGIDVVSDVRTNDVKHAYSGVLAARYAITGGWNLGADAEYAHNPDFKRDLRVFFKALYHFGTKGGA